MNKYSIRCTVTNLYVKGIWCDAQRSDRELFAAKIEAKQWLETHVHGSYQRNFEVVTEESK